MPLKDFALCYFIQLLFSAGVIVLYGYLIFLCNRRFYRNFGKNARAVCYVTGAIGTPIHELSHAIMAILFRHKIKEIKFFQIDSQSDNLGYVIHSYNRKSLYQQIGNFFIGTAPIILMSLLLYVLSYFLIPGFVASINRNISPYSLVENPLSLPILLLKILTIFISASKAGWKWWVFLVAGMLFSLHMNLSKTDMKNSVKGFFLFVAAILAFDCINVFLFGEKPVLDLTATIISVSTHLITILTIALILSIAAVIVSYICRLFA